MLPVLHLSRASSPNRWVSKFKHRKCMKFGSLSKAYWSPSCFSQWVPLLWTKKYSEDLRFQEKEDKNLRFHKNLQGKTNDCLVEGNTGFRKTPLNTDIVTWEEPYIHIITFNLWKISKTHHVGCFLPFMFLNCFGGKSDFFGSQPRNLSVQQQVKLTLHLLLVTHVLE